MEDVEQMAPYYEPSSPYEVNKVLHYLCRISHAASVKQGFWGHPGDKENSAEKIALMHSELSECLEALRVPGGKPSDKIPGFSAVDEELADLLIRVFDFCGRGKHDLGRAILAKMKYNEQRPFKHEKDF